MKKINYIIGMGLILSVFAITLLLNNVNYYYQNNKAGVIDSILSVFGLGEESSEKEILSLYIKHPIYSEATIFKDDKLVILNVPWNIAEWNVKPVVEVSSGANSYPIYTKYPNYNELEIDTERLSGYRVVAEDGTENIYKFVITGSSYVEPTKYISTCQDLQDISLFLSGDYILKDNIDCSGFGYFVPIGNSSSPFSGALDGNGYVISGLSIDNKPYSYAGLFGVLSGNVSNVKIINSSIRPSSTYTGSGATTGGIAGWLKQSGTIVDSSFNGNISSKWNTGGLVGKSDGQILGSYTLGSVTAGYYSSKSSKSHLSVGGLVGVQGSTGKIINSYSGMQVSASGGYPSYIQQAGGLVGDSYGEIKNSYSFGNVTGGYCFRCTITLKALTGGGLVSADYEGNFYGKVIDSYWDVNTSGQSTSAAGVGKNTSEMKMFSTYENWDRDVWNISEGFYPVLNWQEYKNIDNNTYLDISTCKELQSIEGNNPNIKYELVNNIDCSDTKNWNSGKGFNPINSFSGILNGNGFYISGLYINRPSQSNVGLFSNLLGSVSNLGLVDVDVTGYGSVGALAGSGGNVAFSYSTGNVKGKLEESTKGAYVGGLVGDSSSVINSYSKANVFGYYAGGLVGKGNKIENSYSIGTVTGEKIGGLGAYLTGIVENSYYNKDTSTPTPAWNIWQTSTEKNNIGKTTSELKTVSTYENWDFDTVWNTDLEINDGYPYIKSQKLILDIKVSPSSLKLSSGPTSAQISWTISKNAKSCVKFSGGDYIDETWSGDVSPLKGTYTKNTKIYDYTYGISPIYGIRCIGEDENIYEVSKNLIVQW